MSWPTCWIGPTRRPQAWSEMSKQLWTWRAIDAELAELGRDSLVGELTAAVRSGDQEQLVAAFETPRLDRVEVTGGAGDRRLVGQLDPAGPAELQAAHRGRRDLRRGRRARPIRDLLPAARRRSDPALRAAGRRGRDRLAGALGGTRPSPGLALPPPRAPVEAALPEPHMQAAPMTPALKGADCGRTGAAAGTAKAGAWRG